jgi:hypothetical protein
MTPRSFVQPGSSERTKLAVHAVLGATSGACFLYNVAAWCWRREHHLALNVGLYGLITLIEVSQVGHHLDHIRHAK